ncbi:hypothetical protein ACET3Z_000370 [Daucus carota]
MKRSGWRISKEEALERHASFCEESRSPPEKPTEELISALKQLVIRSLVSPTSVRPLEVVKCQCCELIEECTIAYIARVRERNEGWWICGLCGEAVKEEMKRSGWRISKEEALERHTSFCEESRSPPEKPTEELISALKQLLMKSCFPSMDA